MAARWSSLRNAPHRAVALATIGILGLVSCRTPAPAPPPAPAPAVSSPTTATPVRHDDEIIVAGRRFHTGARVITWRDPGGYNAYAAAPPLALRETSLPAAEKKRVREHGWDLPTLRRVVDQFVLHYDVCGVSKVCFDVLHARGLNVHFLLDVDGTIYQTLDLQERALHATTSNDRSIGVEIASIGAYPPKAAQPLAEWYRRDPSGGTIITVPARIKDPRIATPRFTGRPARSAPIRGDIQGRPLVQYDFTPQQYAALEKLAAALCRVFPLIRADLPRDRAGHVPMRKLPDADLVRFRGILGHYHIQDNKADPGPAFQWDEFLAGVRRELALP